MTTDEQRKEICKAYFGYQMLQFNGLDNKGGVKIYEYEDFN